VRDETRIFRIIVVYGDRIARCGTATSQTFQRVKRRYRELEREYGFSLLACFDSIRDRQTEDTPVKTHPSATNSEPWLSRSSSTLSSMLVRTLRTMSQSSATSNKCPARVSERKMIRQMRSRRESGSVCEIAMRQKAAAISRRKLAKATSGKERAI
jgi:hypothetical protein